eukprot:TRINITY_DN18739_c0_g1_i1.p1 TRINITY_DN18739_c0_g1~~TRINITY_DN18739_c0_g1_i1.p1  ORF type:complete len:873 (-),score=304.54 TRINITY_DN18739_c0_g1_i1:71-2659(-)
MAEQQQQDCGAEIVVPDMVQFVDGDGNFMAVDDPATDSISADTFLKTRPKFLARGLDYAVVAILGAQSSGKSTLLNLLFGTKFRVLNAQLTRTRTTHGVWLGFPKTRGYAAGNEDSVVLLDVEGTDGTCREDNISFERKTSLFSLALASVLIVNLWYQDIGRYNAANLSLLRAVFELNLQLFQRAESPKTLILFIVRDHVSNTTPLEELQKILMRDLEELWTHITKPEQFADAKLTQFFEFQFTSLPHMLLEKDDFLQEVGLLRDRFLNPKNADWYLHPRHRRDIPSDGLSHFASEVWSVVKDNRDLDIPSQKHMLATYRCEEIASAAYNKFAEQATPLREQLQASKECVVDGFGTTFRGLFDAAMEAYAKPSSRYLKEVADQKREGLVEMLVKDVHLMFELQVAHATVAALAQLDADIAPLRADKCAVPIDGVGAALRAAEERCLGRWRGVVTSSVAPPELEWPYDTEKKAFEAGVAQRIAEAKRRQIARLVDICRAEQAELLGAVLTDALERVEEDMWMTVREAYHRSVGVAEKRFVSCLSEGFQLKPEEVEAQVDAFRQAIAQALFTAAKQRVEFVPYKMDKRFVALFSMDSRGLPRRWRPHDDIGAVFFKARDGAEQLLDRCLYLRLAPEDDRLVFLTRKTGDGAERPLILLDVPTVKEVGDRDPPAFDKAKMLLPHHDAMEALENFRRNAQIAYMQALRDQEQVSSRAHVPAALIVLIVVLGFNEFKTIVFNPLLLVPFCMIAVLVYVLYALHLGGLVEDAFSLLMSTTMASVVDTIRARLRSTDESQATPTPGAGAAAADKSPQMRRYLSAPAVHRVGSPAARAQLEAQAKVNTPSPLAAEVASVETPAGDDSKQQ